jgi:hypothetical protein
VKNTRLGYRSAKELQSFVEIIENLQIAQAEKLLSARANFWDAAEPA